MLRVCLLLVFAGFNFVPSHGHGMGAKTSQPPKLAQAPAKHAAIVADWPNAYFFEEGHKLTQSLRARGWLVSLIDAGNLPAGKTLAQAIKDDLLSRAKPGDQVLIDLQADGTEGKGVFRDKNAKQTPKTAPSLTYSEALVLNENAETLRYPESDLDAFRDHELTVGLSAGEIEKLASDLLKKKLRVAVIDHSGTGGATNRVLENLDSENTCAITTAGVMTIAPGGYPEASPFFEERKSPSEKSSLEELAHYLSEKLYDNDHSSAALTYTSGYRTGCNKTMALRETFTLAALAHDTWWDWNQRRISHVARSPWRYADHNYENYVLPYASPDGAPDPRRRIGRGWVRWHLETLNRFRSENSFASWVVGLNRNILPKADTSLVNTIYAKGLALHNTVVRQRDQIAALDNSLLQQVSLYGSRKMPAHEYLRKAMARSCLCPDSRATSQGKVDCSETGINLPAEYDMRPLSVCEGPFEFADQVLAQARFGNSSVYDDLALVREIEAQLEADMISLSKAIEDFEAGCVSKACLAQEL